MAGPTLNPELLRRIASRQGLDDLDVGTIDGRADLRGYRISASVQLENPREWTVGGVRVAESRSIKLERLDLADLDLRDAVLDGVQILDSTITNCRFDGAKLRDSVWRRTVVVDCAFDRADLRESSLGSGTTDSRFERCTFRGAALGRTALSAEFVDNDFADARFVRGEFRGARLVRCRFAGPLREVAFHARRRLMGWEDTLEDVDFAEAEFHFVEFHHLNLAGVRLPENDRHLVLREVACTLDHAIRALETTSNRDQKGHLELLESHRQRLGPKQDVDVFGLADFEGSDAAATTNTVAALRAAQETCLAPHR